MKLTNNQIETIINRLKKKGYLMAENSEKLIKKELEPELPDKPEKSTNWLQFTCRACHNSVKVPEEKIKGRNVITCPLCGEPINLAQ